MKSFYEYMNIIKEAPEAEPASAPPTPAPNAPAASMTPPPMDSGGLGMGAMPSLGGPQGGLPGAEPGMDASQQQVNPVSPKKIKSLNVWDALENLIKNSKS